MVKHLKAFRAQPLDDLLTAIASSIEAQQQKTNQLQEIQQKHSESHEKRLGDVETLQQEHTINVRESLDAQSELILRQAEDIKVLSSKLEASERECSDLRASVNDLSSQLKHLEVLIIKSSKKEEEERVQAIEEEKRLQEVASIENKANEENIYEQAHMAVLNSKRVHTSITKDLNIIKNRLDDKQEELECSVKAIEKNHEGKETKDSVRESFASNLGDHLTDLLHISSRLQNTLAPQLTQYGIHVEFAQRQASWLQMLQKNAPGNATETTLVTGLNQDVATILNERTALLDQIERTTIYLNKTFVDFQNIVLKDVHNQTANYCEKSVIPMLQTDILSKVERLIEAQSENIQSVIDGSIEAVKTKKAEQKLNRKRRQAEISESTSKTGRNTRCSKSDGRIEDSSKECKTVGQCEEINDKNSSGRFESSYDYSDEETVEEGSSNEVFKSETQRLENGLNILQEKLKATSASVDEVVAEVRQSTTSTRDHVKGIFARIGDMETKNEVLDNAVAAIRFTIENMKLWKQDVESEIEQVRASIPETPEPYDDSKMQEQLNGLAKNVTKSLLNLKDTNKQKGHHDEAVKAALEEQASAIAHLVATKADQKMVEEGLNSKADSALELGLREFMKKVALDIDDRDYRSGKIASSERAQLETRILRMVTSSLRRIRRQQSMLSRALPQGSMIGETALAGVVYKCLSCNRAAPPQCLEPRNLTSSFALSGGSAVLLDSNYTESGTVSEAQFLNVQRPVTAPHSHGVMSSRSSVLRNRHADFSEDPATQARRNMHTFSPYKVKGAGFRVANKQITH